MVRTALKGLIGAALLGAALLFVVSCSLESGSTSMSDEDVADVAASEISTSTGGDLSTMATASADYNDGTTVATNVQIVLPYSTYSHNGTIALSGSTLSIDSSSSGTVDRPRLSGSFTRSTSNLSIVSSQSYPVSDGVQYVVTVNGSFSYSGQHEYTSLWGSGSFAVLSDTTQTWSNVVMTASVSVSGGVTTITLSPTSGSVTISGTMQRQRTGYVGTREVAWSGDLTITFGSGGSATASFSDGGTVTIDLAGGEAS